MTMLCPNCRADLPEAEASLACGSCKASFGPGAAWKPLSRNAGSERVETGLSKLALLAAVCVFGTRAAVHFYEGLMHPWNPVPSVLLGLVASFAGLTVYMARKSRGLLLFTFIICSLVVFASRYLFPR
jgi:hypothetical protein